MFKHLFLSTAAVATPIAAQSLDQPSPGNLVESVPLIASEDVVVTGVRAEQDRRETGQAITIIGRDEIERRQTVAVADLLATTPGVTVTRNGSVGGFTGVRLRGAEAEQTLVVIDGVRVNDPSSPGGGFDFANLLSSSIERIEILRGPNSVPWGSQAIGGVVNIITATPPADGVTARARAEYGHRDQGFASAGVSGARGAVSASLTGGYLRTDGISAAASGTERDGYRQYGANGRLGLEIAEGIGVDLRGYYADSRTEIDGNADEFPFAPVDDAQFSTARELYGYAGLRADLAGGRFRNRVAFTIADIDRDNFRTGVEEPLFLGRGRSERYEYQGDFRPVEQVRLIAGVEHEDSRFRAQSFGDFASTDIAKVGITSAYGQLVAKPVQHLTLTSGVRHDDHEQFGSETTFGGDAALALDTGTTLRVSYGEGFKAPTLFQLYAAFIGDADLTPERARNYGAGVEQSLLDGRARIGATYFRRRTRDQIDFDLGTFTYANIARTRAEGIELEIALRPVDALTVTADYSFIDAENRSAGANFGNDLARRPRETLSVNADYRFPFGLGLGGTVTQAGDSFDDMGNTVRLDGFVLASVRAELPVGERFALYGRVDNLFDERYQTVGGYGTFGRAAYGGVRVRLD
ncbi:MAG TPA: TonB-dependent receptor [Sphingomonas sp.]|jgi:vitamin B12 transporter|uniref:TonB-dependent receptor plug domain-containing protein n=1 Tax=Sphingomonas sp. TaxID=28214 RepID=UPI002ED7BFC9